MAHQISAAQLGGYDLIVALDRRHQQTLRSLGADPHRLFLLHAFDPAAGAAADVPDPYYGDDAAFDDYLAMITAACTGLVSELTGLWEGSVRRRRVGRLGHPDTLEDSDYAHQRGPFLARLMMARSCAIVPTWSHAGSANGADKSQWSGSLSFCF